jgi:hypothetical protein
MLETLPTFPCAANKSPLARDGFKSARIRRVVPKAWPLVGVRTGRASGIDALDVDPTGKGWLDANRNRIPRTRTQQTRRGLHLFFKHADGLRCSVGKIAPGIDVRADGGYVIWWHREGLPCEAWPIWEWPEWLLQEAMNGQRASKGPSTPIKDLTSFLCPSKASERLREAFEKLDPCQWNGDYDGWKHLLLGVKAAGIERDQFVEWCVRDPDYENDGDEIAQQWDAAVAIHAGALYAALKDAGIRPRALETRQVPNQQHKTKPVDWRIRYHSILDKLEAKPCEPMLFWAACTVAEIMIEYRKPKPSLATDQLMAVCKRNGLLSVLGSEGCRDKIQKAFDHVEQKELAK